MRSMILGKMNNNQSKSENRQFESNVIYCKWIFKHVKKFAIKDFSLVETFYESWKSVLRKNCALSDLTKNPLGNVCKFSGFAKFVNISTSQTFPLIQYMYIV